MSNEPIPPSPTGEPMLLGVVNIDPQEVHRWETRIEQVVNRPADVTVGVAMTIALLMTAARMMAYVSSLAPERWIELATSGQAAAWAQKAMLDWGEVAAGDRGVANSMPTGEVPRA